MVLSLNVDRKVWWQDKQDNASTDKKQRVTSMVLRYSVCFVCIQWRTQTNGIVSPIFKTFLETLA